MVRRWASWQTAIENIIARPSRPFSYRLDHSRPSRHLSSFHPFTSLPMLPSLPIPYIPLILSSSFPFLSYSLTILFDPLLPHPFPFLYVPYISSHSFPSLHPLLIHFRPFHPFLIPSYTYHSQPSGFPPFSFIPVFFQWFTSLPIPFYILPSLPIPCHLHPFRSLNTPFLPPPFRPLCFFSSFPIPYIPSYSFPSLPSFHNPCYAFPSQPSGFPPFSFIPVSSNISHPFPFLPIPCHRHPFRSLVIPIPSVPLIPNPFPLHSFPSLIFLFISSHPLPSPASLLIHFRPFHPSSTRGVTTLKKWYGTPVRGALLGEGRHCLKGRPCRNAQCWRCNTALQPPFTTQRPPLPWRHPGG